jgi:Cu-Zn family superoxide dismutase
MQDATMQWKEAIVLGAALAIVAPAWADQARVKMQMIDAQGVGNEIGTVNAEDTPDGLRLTPDLAGLPAGSHGFHFHQNPSCDPAEKDGVMTAGLAAGSHYDPENTGMHEGPYGKGHLGDLPVLVVATEGTASEAVVAPRLKVSDLKGRSLIIHANPDNYSDQPEPLGGSGARIACGVIE